MTRREIRFVVPGIPAGQGSMKAVVSRSTRRVIAKHPPKTLAFRAQVAHAAWLARRKAELYAPWRGAAGVSLQVFLPRPKSAPKKRRLPTTKGLDLDKAIRLVGDAITGVVIVDDSQIVQWSATKLYDPAPRILVVVELLDESSSSGAAMPSACAR